MRKVIEQQLKHNDCGISAVKIIYNLHNLHITRKYIEDNKEQFFVYLDFNGETPYYNDSVKGCCINLIGEFLMLARSGFKQYDFEYTQTKINQLKLEGLTTSIVCLLNFLKTLLRVLVVLIQVRMEFAGKFPISL